MFNIQFDYIRYNDPTSGSDLCGSKIVVCYNVTAAELLPTAISIIFIEVEPLTYVVSQVGCELAFRTRKLHLSVVRHHRSHFHLTDYQRIR